jgi:hypothetical protein
MIYIRWHYENVYNSGFLKKTYFIFSMFNLHQIERVISNFPLYELSKKIYQLHKRALRF